MAVAALPSQSYVLQLRQTIQSNALLVTCDFPEKKSLYTKNTFGCQGFNLSVLINVFKILKDKLYNVKSPFKK